ncbi:hypothetical protein HK097_001937 [Rhizophlyctis rosea]|uniref:Uncharacterized protein n=1 Tax=Rhizophlyctis rosea TaxID=64517 RepID=A0AAD5SLK4_9FUNG|nr:hypothetical protein HK097_001937 [Rhizophlyctis rosea]
MQKAEANFARAEAYRATAEAHRATAEAHRATASELKARVEKKDTQLLLALDSLGRLAGRVIIGEYHPIVIFIELEWLILSIGGHIEEIERTWRPPKGHYDRRAQWSQLQANKPDLFAKLGSCFPQTLNNKQLGDAIGATIDQLFISTSKSHHLLIHTDGKAKLVYSKNAFPSTKHRCVLEALYEHEGIEVDVVEEEDIDQIST